MIERGEHPEFHPRWYRQRISTYWWLQRRSHLAFIVREISSVFVAWFVVFLLLLVRAVSQGDESYRHFLDWSRGPGILLLNLASAFFIAFHAITWFNLAPQAMAVRLGGRRVPGALIAGSNYAAWALVSLAIAWIVLRAR
jgi:fumarate reductase subunit C